MLDGADDDSSGRRSLQEGEEGKVVCLGAATGEKKLLRVDLQGLGTG